MTKPISIDLVANRDRAGIGYTEYDLTLKGESRQDVRVARKQDTTTGEIFLSIEAAKTAGKAGVNNAQMDAIARALDKRFKAYAGTNGHRYVRRYILKK